MSLTTDPSDPRLVLVREEIVPIEQLRKGDRLILPGGRRVTIERVDEYPEGLIARWWRPAERGEPGHPGGHDRVDQVTDEWDGRYLGSTILCPAGTCWTVDRA